MNEVFLNIVRKIPFFSFLTNEEHEGIVEKIKLHFFPAGHTIFRIGDPGDNMYVIREGSVEVLDEKGQIIAILGENEFFGEMALISSDPRNATVRVRENSELFSLDRECLLNIFQKYPLMGEVICHTYLSREEENRKYSQS